MHILCLLTQRITSEDTDDDVSVIIGYRPAPVFGYGQTDGNPLAADPSDADWLRELPLRAVAERWGIAIDVRDATTGAHGSFQPGAINLGVGNLSTWRHELMHAADHRNGRLTERGQHWRSETVAELGGAVLLELLGYHQEADLGGCWDYIRTYADRASISPLAACNQVLQRTCDAVAAVLKAAEDAA